MDQRKLRDLEAAVHPKRQERKGAGPKARPRVYGMRLTAASYFSLKSAWIFDSSLSVAVTRRHVPAVPEVFQL